MYLQQSKGVPRYGLLETVRRYGLQQRERAGEATALRDRHLAWCVTLAEQAAPALLGRDQVVWLVRLDRELDNLRAAMQWALDRGLSTLGLRVAGGLWKFRLRRRHQREGRRWLAALLALAADDAAAAAMAVRATALEGAAWLTQAIGAPVRRATGSLKIPVETVRPFHWTCRGRPACIATIRICDGYSPFK